MPYYRITVDDLSGVYDRGRPSNRLIWIDETAAEARDAQGNPSDAAMRQMAQVKAASLSGTSAGDVTVLSRAPEGFDPKSDPSFTLLGDPRPADYANTLELFRAGDGTQQDGDGKPWWQGGRAGEALENLFGGMGTGAGEKPVASWDGSNWVVTSAGETRQAVADELPPGEKLGVPPTGGAVAGAGAGAADAPDLTALQKLAESVYPQETFRSFLQDQGLGGLHSGMLSPLLGEGLGKLGSSAFQSAANIRSLDEELAAKIGGGYDPSEESGGFRGFLAQQPGGGMFGLPGLAQNVLRTLTGITPTEEFDPELMLLADPETDKGVASLHDLAYGSALQNLSPLVARTMTSSRMRDAINRQWQRKLAGGGERPTFAGFLAERAGMLAPGAAARFQPTYG